MLRLLIWFLMLTRAICTLYLNDLTGESYEVSLLDHSRSPLLGEMESLTPPYSSSTVQTPHVDHDKQLHHREQSKTQHDMSHLRSSTSRKRGLADGDSIVDPYPTPFTDNNRILGLLLNFNFGHIDPLMMIFNEYTSMCEGGWLPTVVLFTTVDWTNKLKRIVKTRNFCYRINRPLEIKAIKYPKSINIGLAAEHRKYMAMHWQDYDLFLYHEDDIIFRYPQVNAFAIESQNLDKLLPETGLHDHTIGFQRYRHLWKPGEHTGDYGEQDIVEQDLLEETPNFNPVCLGTKGIAEKDKIPYVHIQGNTHTGAFMLMKKHVRLLQTKCEFLNQSSPSREFMSSFSIFDHKPHHCGLHKLLPAVSMSSFWIYHFFQQRLVSWYPTIVVDDSVHSGHHYISQATLQMPPCWNDIVNRTRTDMAIDVQEAKDRENIEKQKIAKARLEARDKAKAVEEASKTRESGVEQG